MPLDDEAEILLSSMPETMRGRFTKLERIGRGGTGIVYKVWDTMLKRHFALKVLNPDQATEKRILRLHQEAKTLCQLQHPNIVSFINFLVTDSGKPILVMELVEGKSLEAIIDQNGPLPTDQSLEIMLQICAAMEYAHEHGVLHRDLSASNILLRKKEDGTVEIKVVDFGISKVENVQDRTIVKSGQLIGSVTVISPEQARGQNTDARSDIYSLGCLMFKAFSGSFPYRGKTILETIDKHINEVIPSIPDHYPPELNSVINKALQKLPEDRYQNIAEMREAIENINRVESEEEFEEEPESSTDLKQPALTNLLNAVSLQMKNFTVIFIGVAIAIVSIGAVAFALINPQPSKNAVVETKKEPLSDVVITIENDQKWLSAVNQSVTTFPRSLFSELNKHPQIRRVALTNLRVPNDQLKKLCKYDLQILDLKNTTINDQSLEIISKCPSLKSLLLRKCRNITNFGMSSLLAMDNLIILSVSDTAISSKGLIPLLQKNKNIKVLHATGCPGIKEDVLPFLLALPKVDSIRLNGTGIGRRGARTLLNTANQVGFLGLGSLQLEDSDFPIRAPRSLSRLDICKNPNLTGVTFKKLKGWPNLNFLNVEGCDRIPNNFMEQSDENYNINHLLIAPSLIFDWERDDTESYFEPTLYDLCGTNQRELKKMILKWSRDKKERDGEF